MIESAAGKLAHWLKSQVPEHPQSEENLQFGFHLILNTVISVAFASILGFLFGSVDATLKTLYFFGILRMMSGGFHFKSALLCIIVSSVVGTILPHLEVSTATITLLNVCNILLVVIFAPSGIENQTRIPKKYYPLLKVASVLLVSSNLFIGSDLIAVTWFVQSISLIRFPLKGGERI